MLYLCLVMNDNADSNYVIFTIKVTKLYVPIVTLSAKIQSKTNKIPQQKI